MDPFGQMLNQAVDVASSSIVSFVTAVTGVGFLSMALIEALNGQYTSGGIGCESYSVLQPWLCNSP